MKKIMMFLLSMFAYSFVSGAVPQRALSPVDYGTHRHELENCIIEGRYGDFKKNFDPAYGDLLPFGLCHGTLLRSVVSLSNSEYIQKEVDLINFLINQGVSPWCTDCYGRTPAGLASKYGKVELHRVLMQRMEDSLLKEKCDELVATKNDYSWWPFYAAFIGDNKLVDWLFSLGVNFNIVDSFGRNPIHWAAAFGNSNVIDFLSKYYKDINTLLLQKDNQGNSPLWLAVVHGHIDMIACLVEQGSVIDSRIIQQAWDDEQSSIAMLLEQKLQDLEQKLQEQKKDAQTKEEIT